MLVATALVMLMLVPGLALFYGGLVRAKNLLSVMSQVLGITAVAILTWVLWGYSLAFYDGNAVIGGFGKVGLGGVGPDSLWPVGASGKAIPELLFAAFQMSFAAITGALVIGALVERVRFVAIMLFAMLWLTLVYAPLAHMVWASDGLLFRFGAIDFAGGTVVHINAGVAGLVGVAFAGARIGHLKEPMPPHSLALTMVGAGLLWVGWFGFNAGSALEASGVAAVAMVNTLVGASGAVAGLVAVTPAAGVSGPIGAMLLGCAASLVCYGFVGSLKNRLRLDDSLDVFGIHGLGGITGSIGTAVVALPALGGHAGEDYSLWWQLLRQVAAVLVAVAWSAAGSALCFAAVKAVMPLRHLRDAEREGLDITDHGERAYNY
jgi:Amt family ammonium transporter